MLDSLEHWLKTTIPGIVILGAAGSIVALLLLGVLRVVLARLWKPIADQLALSWATHVVRSTARLWYVMGYFEGGHNWYGLGTFILYTLVKLIIMVAGAGVSLVMFAFYAQQKPAPVGALFILSVGFFMYSFSVLRVFLVVWLEYSRSVRPIELKAAARAKEKVQVKAVREVLRGKDPDSTPGQAGPPEV